MTDADARAQEIARCVRGCTTDEQYIELVDHIAAALRERPASYRAGVEDAAEVALDYARHMETVAKDRMAKGKPSTVSESKQDAGSFLAAAIRALAPKEEVKMETTAEERAQYRSYGVGFPSQDSFATRMVRDFDRLLALAPKED